MASAATIAGWRPELRSIGQRVRLDQLGFWRHRQQVFWSFFMPVLLLVLLGEMNRHRVYAGMRVVDWEVPGLLTFGLVAAVYTNLAVTITTQREAGILKRLRATPLAPRTFVLGQLGSSLLVAAGLTAVFVAAAWLLFGIDVPLAHAPAFLLTVAAGAACFAALGVAVTAVIRSAESATPVATASYLPLALISGIFYPGDTGPDWLRTITAAMPLRPLALALQACFAHGPGLALRPGQLLVVAAWTAVGAACATKFFRWFPVRTST